MGNLTTMTELSLVRATISDLPYILATERKEGYEEFVGRWSEEKHRRALEDGHHAYFVGQVDKEPVGFAILRDWASPEQVILLKRIAVSRPGQGLGKRLLAALVERVFWETDAHRLWLGVFPDNLRARRAYEAVGFVTEGLARGAAFFGGVHRDELVMAVLRTDRIKAVA
jgi:RimJ/RimL family protein N-acetyltransferase